LLLRLAFGWLPDRVGLRRMVLPAMAAYASGLLVLAAARGELGVLLAGLLCGIGHACAYPVYCSLVIARAHPAQRGAAMAIYISVEWAAMLIAGPMLGELIERAGYPVMFATLSAVLALGTALFHAFDRPGAALGAPAQGSSAKQ
jgi:MFS family permease